MKNPISLMSMRVHGTCHSRACEGWHPAHGSPLSHVFFKNLHRKQALSFLISLACFRWSGLRGPFLRPTRFSVSGLALCDCFLIVFSVAFAIGLFFEAFLLGGEDEPCDTGDLVGDDDFLMSGRVIWMGLTALEFCEPWSIEYL
jgi:hypothetical protein